jgi:hypothetical protein
LPWEGEAEFPRDERLRGSLAAQRSGFFSHQPFASGAQFPHVLDS